MIMDFLASYWEEKDIQRLEEIRQEEHACLDKLADTGDTSQKEAILERLSSLEEQDRKIQNAVEERYIKSRSKKEIMADAEKIVSAIEKQDFLDRLEERVQQLASLKVNGANEESIDILKKYTIENFENCQLYILHFLRVQLNALAGDEQNTDKILAIVDKRVSLWYVKPQPAYLPLAHGKATDALAFMSSRSAKIDRITGNATIDKFGVQLAILKLQELHATLGISTDKLLSTAIAIFTQHNDFRHTKNLQLKREVAISLKEYAKLCGYDVEEHETSTPEEAEREKKRAKAQLDNARKAIRKDLDVLYNISFEWEEVIKGKVDSYSSVRLLSSKHYKDGYLYITFTPEIASYLAERNLITQYPTKLLRISGRQPTAYYVGRKLAEHYNIDNNQRRGTYDRISIPALLAVTDLASYEEVQRKDRGHWVERIKEPLEQALDTLTQEGVLKNWEYTHAKGVPLTDEEASTITSYEEFAKLYLRFTPADRVDHTERIQAKQEARKKKATKKKS